MKSVPSLLIPLLALVPSCTSIKCFTSNEELREAVNNYIADNSPDSPLAETYGVRHCNKHIIKLKNALAFCFAPDLWYVLGLQFVALYHNCVDVVRSG